MKNQIIVMMGGQGVGKGTFAKELMKNHDYKHIEVGAMLRKMPPSSTVAQIIARGDFVPDDILFDIMTEIIIPDGDIILDGFPRSLSQAQWLVQNYADKFDIHVLYLSVPEDVMLARINKRINDGEKRNDDSKPEVIRHRLDTFWKVTMPAIKWLGQIDEIKFSDVDVTGQLDENMARINQALQK